MQAKRYLIPAILLFSLALTGCGKSTKTPTADNQATASQANSATPGNSDSNAAPGTNAAADNNASNQAPTIDNSASSQPASTPAPQPLVIPAGTSITVRLQQGLSSASAAPGERFSAVVDEPIVLGDQTVIAVGTPVTGHVTVARRSGRLRHPGELGLTLDTVDVNNQEVPLTTSHIVVRGASHKKRNLRWIGGGTGGGAVIGALAAGGKGALIGSGIGAVAGTTTAFITGKKDVGFAAERRLRFRLNREVSLSA